MTANRYEAFEQNVRRAKESLVETLDKRADFRRLLFPYGFVITDDGDVQNSSFPFYGNWNESAVGAYRFIVRKEQTFFTFQTGGRVFFLIGHAYDPFVYEADENVLLKNAAQAYAQNKDAYQDVLNDWTGVYVTGIVEGNEIELQLDAEGMQYACYGIEQGKFCVVSHIELPRDLYGLRTTEFASRLIQYKYYRYMFGDYLPGADSPFENFKRLLPNTTVRRQGASIKITRFYPNKPLEVTRDEKEYQEIARYGAEIMKKNLALIGKKWNRPAISLTGGIDSNTTFAAANGLYDRFETFSYVSMYRESVDADAAKKISDRFGVKHTRYQIPDSNEQIEDYDALKSILTHNAGYIGNLKDDDTRKKIILEQTCDIDVEVKSWVSESIRAYAYKYYGRKKFPKSFSAKDCAALYKMFFFDRKLFRETAERFEAYYRESNLKERMFNYDPTEFFVWENMHGGKCGLNVTSMKFCFNVTIPYNNRNWLDILLRTPLQKRIDDSLHLDMKRTLNPELYDMGIRVVNLNETELRKKFLNCLYTFNRWSPF